MGRVFLCQQNHHGLLDNRAGGVCAGGFQNVGAGQDGDDGPVRTRDLSKGLPSDLDVLVTRSYSEEWKDDNFLISTA